MEFIVTFGFYSNILGIGLHYRGYRYGPIVSLGIMVLTQFFLCEELKPIGCQNCNNTQNLIIGRMCRKPFYGIFPCPTHDFSFFPSFPGSKNLFCKDVSSVET